MTTYVVDNETIREPTSDDIEELLYAVRTRDTRRFQELTGAPDIAWGDTLRYFSESKEDRNWINAHLPT